MAESTESTEPTGGFDRRSLIKKGLVVGGAAVALPVITTFDAPAFAASPPDFTVARAQFNLLADLGIGGLAIGVLTNSVTPDDTPNCPIAEWTGTPDATGGTVVGHNSLLTLGDATVTYTSATCTFTQAVRTSLLAGCQPGVISGDGHTVTFVVPAVSVGLLENVYLVVHCPV